MMRPEWRTNRYEWSTGLSQMPMLSHFNTLNKIHINCEAYFYHCRRWRGRNIAHEKCNLNVNASRATIGAIESTQNNDYVKKLNTYVPMPVAIWMRPFFKSQLKCLGWKKCDARNRKWCVYGCDEFKGKSKLPTNGFPRKLFATFRRCENFVILIHCRDASGSF